MIRVTDKYIIDVDDMNYTVQEDKHRKMKDKDGNEKDVFVNVGYCTDIDHALEFIRKKMISDKLESGTKSLEEAIEIIRNENNEMREIIKGIKYAN